MDNLERLGNEISVPIELDDAGYLGRECPEPHCLQYFKVMLGTGLPGGAPCHCPYCGHVEEHDHFWTQDQLEYAKSVAFRQVVDAVNEDLKALEFDLPASGPFGLGISATVEPAPLPDLHRYHESALETYVECDECTLKYAVYGVFGYCPDCGKHNSLQILSKSLEVIEKTLRVAASSEPDVAARMTENALEDCVSSFDGFGRELCRVHANRATDPDKVASISFQNLEGAKKNLLAAFGVDLSRLVSPGEWETCCTAYEKRHVFSHKMGVADLKFVQKAGTSPIVAGRKVPVSADEVRELARIVRSLAQGLYDAFGNLPQSGGTRVTI